MEPPPHLANPTCKTQLRNTNNCEARRAGTINDGFCAKTCGLCEGTWLALQVTDTECEQGRTL